MVELAGRTCWQRIAHSLNVILGAMALACPATASAAPAPIAFVHANVVPMDREQVLRDQTVVVSGSTITGIGADLPIPAGAQVIDASGKFLAPGLSDMHTHSQSREDMKVYLANGVTSILNLGGASSDFVDQRVPLLNKGQRPGPHVYLALRIDGTPDYGQLVVKTREDARSAVRLAKTNGYQFIKIYSNLSADAFDEIVRETRREGLGITGHYVRSVDLQRQLSSQNVLVAHLEELMYGLFTPSDEDPLGPPPESLIAKSVQVLKANRGYVVADLLTFETIAAQWGRPDVAESFFARPEAKFVPYEWRLDWRRDDIVNRRGSLDRRAAFEARLAKGLSDAGIPLLAGTDAPTFSGLYPGFSLHDSLDRLVAAGLTRFQALSTATRTAGAYIQATVDGEARFGEVKAGYRADLLLLNQNPLDNLSALRKPEGVMTAGKWYTREELAVMLDKVAADYARVATMGGP